MDTNDLLKKWLSNDLSHEEAQVFDALDDTPFYKRIVEDANSFKAEQFSKMPDFETFKKQRLVVEDTTKVRSLNWFKPMLKIASVLVIGFGIYYYFLFNQMTDVQTQVAEKTTIELPDGSSVALNALTEVHYNADTWNSKREIELEGEAFFDVAKGAKFDVVTQGGTISVLGTEFNVKQRESYFEVFCYEGTVRVVTPEHTKILKVGDHFKMYKDKAVTGKHTQKLPLWTDNMSDFQRIPVSEVFAELERQYGVALTFTNIDTDQLFTGGFVHDNLENALIAVTQPLDLDFLIINSDEVRLSIRE